VHVTLSLIGIVSGLAVASAMVRGRFPAAMTAIFLATTILTSVTGFPLPPYGFDPPRAVDILLLRCTWTASSPSSSASRRPRP
jgi:hypothetical protein